MPRSRHLAALAAVSTCLLAVAPSHGQEPAAPLSVELLSLRSAKGKVGCELFAGPRGFPKDASAAIQGRWCPINQGTATCRFDPIPHGTYAVACFHDENDNGKLDTGLFGIPTEGTVVSNHAKGSFGPPKYDDAKFVFSGQARTLALRMGY